MSTTNKHIKISTIYTKESNIEVPDAVALLQEQPSEIQTELACQSSFTPVVFKEEESFEVDLSFQIECMYKNNHLYTLNFVQSGIFTLCDYEEKEQIEEALAVDCPNIIFPYARLHAHQISNQTGLAPVLIQEINFKELYYKEIGKHIFNDKEQQKEHIT